MSYKKGSVISLLVFLTVGVLGIVFAAGFRVMPGQSMITGPKLYPIVLCSLLILSSLISLIDTLRKADKKIEIKNFHRYFVVLGIIVAWVLLWRYVCGFYFSSLIGIAVMLLYLNPEKLSGLKVLKTLLTDGMITGSIYVVFTVLLHTSI